MKTCPCRSFLAFGALVVFALPSSIASARDGAPVGGQGGRAHSSTTASAKGGFFTRLVDRFSKGGGEQPPEVLQPVSGRAASGRVATVRTEVPVIETVVRGSSAKRGVESAWKAPEGSSKVDLKGLVGGILQRMGPMELERSDEAVIAGNGDALRWLAHPNIAPVVPVAPQPLPFGLSGDEPVRPAVAAPVPEATLLFTKVTDKLERLRVAGVDPAPTVPVSGLPPALSREEIESRALLAVARKRLEETSPMAGRLPAESRISPLSLLAGAESTPAGAALPVEAAVQPRRELRGLLEVDLQPIDQLPPARRLSPALERTRPLVLLQPDGMASRP